MSEEEKREWLYKGPETRNLQITNRKLSLSFARCVSTTIRLSLMTAEVPMRWKHSFVVPIPKKPPHSCAQNYRPISITSVFLRVFEKHLVEFLISYSKSKCQRLGLTMHSEVCALTISVVQHGSSLSPSLYSLIYI
ncbi:hypothetical protein COOONC_00950 [Cooperia oncophora]